MKIQNVTMHRTGSVIYTFFNADRSGFQSFSEKCFAVCLFFFSRSAIKQ